MKCFEAETGRWPVAGNRPTRPDDGRAERERKMMLDKNGVEIRTGCIVEIVEITAADLEEVPGC